VARDHALMETDFQVVGGYLSAVSDEYKKPGLAPAIHRVNMCRLAVRKSSDWLMVDPWEALVQTEYSKTADVLDHFEEEINGKRRGIPVLDEDGNEVERRKARIMLLAGSDLIQTMSEPGVWDEKDLHHILGNFGCFIVERAESEIDQSIFSSSSVHSRSPLALYRDNIFMVSQLVRNDVSSTKVRLFLRKGMVCGADY
jgi:nicotinamide mononucleotide adenylyltransferase